MQVSVREATAADDRVILAMVRQLGDEFGVTAELRPGYVTEYLTFPGCHVLLAEDREAGGTAGSRPHPLGLLTFSLRPNLFHGADAGLVEESVVARDARRHGVGTLLMQTAMDAMRTGGCAEAGVATGFDNKPARRLYARFGLIEESLLLERHFDDGG